MNRQVIIDNTKMKLYQKIDENIKILAEDSHHESPDIVKEMQEQTAIYMDLREQVNSAKSIIDLVNILQDDWLFGYESATHAVAEFLLNESYT